MNGRVGLSLQSSRSSKALTSCPHLKDMRETTDMLNIMTLREEKVFITKAFYRDFCRTCFFFTCVL